MTRVNYNLSVLPSAIPEQDALLAANKLNEHRYQNLTNKQRLFVDAYLQHDFDHVKAAKEVGFGDDEANRVGKKMLRRPEIQKAIQYALEYYSEATKLRFERLIEEYKIIALTSIDDIVDLATGDFRTDIGEGDVRLRAVKKIKRTTTKYGENVEIEMYDRMAAFDKLVRILNPNASQGDPDGASSGNTTNNVTNNNVTQIAIVPVPSGQFLPAPPSPYQAGDDVGPVIEHTGSAAMPHQGVVSNVPRALVPLANVG